MTPEKAGIYRDIPEHDYRAWDAVNQSLLKIIEEQSPAHARADQLRPRKSTPAQVLGTAIHALLLEPMSFESRFIARPEGIDGRTKDGKAALVKLEAERNGRTVVPADEYANTRDLVQSVIAHDELLDLLTSPGITEGSFLWKDDRTGLWCKGRCDRLTMHEGVSTVVDLKSTNDASPKQFVRDVVNYGYEVQAAWYLHGLSQLSPIDRRYLIAAVEKEPPYAIGLYELDSILLDRGKRIWQRTLDLWSECLKSGAFPAYEPCVLDAPEWVVREASVLDGR